MKRTDRFVTPGPFSLRSGFIGIACAALLLFATAGTRADEGMYPLSEIGKLNLAAHGLKVTAADIFNPGGVGLVDAVDEDHALVPRDHRVVELHDAHDAPPCRSDLKVRIHSRSPFLQT